MNISNLGFCKYNILLYLDFKDIINNFGIVNKDSSITKDNIIKRKYKDIDIRVLYKYIKLWNTNAHHKKVPQNRNISFRRMSEKE